MTSQEALRGHRLHGRHRPYTAIGVRRLPCFRCGERSHATWQICSDANLYRPVCLECDIELNRLVLKFFGFEDFQRMGDDYEQARRGEE